MNRLFRLGIPATASVLGLVLLSGCGGSAKAATAAKPSLPAAYPTSTVYTSVLAMKFPVDPYEENATQSGEVDYLSLRLTQLCMKDFGFAYLPGLSTAMIARDAEVMDVARSRLYGISDATAAAAYGYHLPSQTGGSTGPEIASRLPAAEQDVLDGQGVTTHHDRAVPVGGCIEQSRDQLSQADALGTDLQQQDGSTDPAALPHAIDQNAFKDAQSDPRVLAVFAKWSSCMAAFGYHYSTPFAAAGDSRWVDAVGASPAEIQAAERDISCKLRVNLLDVEYSVESGYEMAAMARNTQTMAAAETELSTETAALNRLMKQYAE